MNLPVGFYGFGEDFPVVVFDFAFEVAVVAEGFFDGFEVFIDFEGEGDDLMGA